MAGGLSHDAVVAMLQKRHPGANVGGLGASRDITYSQCECASRNPKYRCDEFIGLGPRGGRHYISWNPVNELITSGPEGYHDNNYGRHVPVCAPPHRAIRAA